MGGTFLRNLIENPEYTRQEEYSEFLVHLYDGKVSSAEAAAFIAVLSARDPSADDIARFVRSVHAISPPVKINASDRAVNIVGTGGGISTFNISTTAAFVASAAGATVIKSGSPGYKSKCGSVDVLRALGLNLHLSMGKFEEMVDRVGIGFVNPDFYSPVLKRMAIMIQPLKIKEIGRFINIVGPLICPIEVAGRLIGVAGSALMESTAEAVRKLGIRNTVICRAEIGLDELSSLGTNHIRSVNCTWIPSSVFSARSFEFPDFESHNLAGGDPSANAKIMKAILKGSIKDARRDTVVLNSALMLCLAKRASDISEGITLSAESIENGSAYNKLDQCLSFCRG